MPLVYAQGKTLPSLLKGIKDEDQLSRLSEAIRMDNRGTWFICRSHWTVAQLERRFTEELVGTVLYERIGGMLQGDKPYIYLQISLLRSVLQKMHPDSEPEWVEVPVEDGKPGYDVVEALKELRIKVLKAVPDIRAVISTGSF